MSNIHNEFKGSVMCNFLYFNPFQRETMGLEGFLWTKVPETPLAYYGDNNYKPIELFYSPILDIFKEGKLDTVRGGIIAEQMG